MNVLDGKTRAIIFGREPLAKLGRSSLDDFMQTPLKNIDEINDRLDAIGELVRGKRFRGSLEALVETISLPDEFYEKLEKFASEIEFHYIWPQTVEVFKNAILGFAQYEELPYFGKKRPRTRIMQEFAEQYAELCSRHPYGLSDFFRYMSDAAKRLRELEEKKRKKGEEKEGADIVRSLTFTYRDNQELAEEVKTLENLLDYKLLKEFYSEVKAAEDFKQALWTYVTLASMAADRKYSRPEIAPRKENCLIIHQGHYRRGGFFSEDNIVPNSTMLNKDTLVEVLEGVNSGGKTFDMKKSIYIATLALSGCWVPAEYAKVSIRDKIILREKGTGEAISAMKQDCNSAKDCTPHDNKYWLIAMDETFTSTEKRGGVALTYGLVEMVLEQGDSLLIISSHYPDLSVALRDEKRVSFNHFPFRRELQEDGEKLVFPYTKISGPMDDYSYAIEVARHHGFDSRVLELAEKRLNG